MKKTNTMILILLSLFILFSCKDEINRGNMEITIENSNPKTLMPESGSVEIVKYKIHGKGPDGSNISFETSRTSYTLEGILIGAWKLEAYGINREGTEIVKGSTTFNLSATNNKAVINLNELVGEGNLDLIFKWEEKRLKNPNLRIIITDSSGKKSEETAEISATEKGKASFYKAGLKAGSYTLQASLYDSNVKYSGFSEAIRIIDKKTTESIINMDIEEDITNSGSLILTNQADVPVKCTISGIEAPIKANTAQKAKLSLINASLDEVNAVWYLDGEKIGEGLEIAFTPTSGFHRLDVVAATSKLGSSGSTYFTFEANSFGSPGEPVLNRLKMEEGIYLDGLSCFSFTNENDIIVSSTRAKTLQICSLNNNTLSNVTTYSQFNSPFLTSDISALCFVDEMSQLFLINDNKSNVVLLDYNSSTETLTKVAENKSILLKKEEIYGSDFSHLIYIPALNQVMSLSSIIPAKYGISQGLTILDPLASNNTEFVHDFRNFGLTGVKNPGPYAMSPNGKDIIFLDSMSGNLGEIHTENVGIINRMSTNNITSDTQRTSGGTAICYIDKDHILIGKDDELIILEKEYPYPAQNMVRKWNYLTSITQDGGNGPLCFIPNHNGGYIYGINRNSTNITTFSIENGRVKKLYTTPLGFTPKDARLSGDGSILLIQEENSNSLHLFKILL